MYFENQNAKRYCIVTKWRYGLEDCLPCDEILHQPELLETYCGNICCSWQSSNTWAVWTSAQIQVSLGVKEEHAQSWYFYNTLDCRR